MDNYGISIIMAVYNVDKYLEIMLDSVFNQTFKEFEIIIVNDGSKDNTENIIIRYMKKYNNIIYLKQENKGLSEARNVALDKINKKYTIFFDGDDYVDKNMLEKMYTKAEEVEADITICRYEKVYDIEDEQRGKEDEVFCGDENKIYRNVEVMELFMDFKVGGFLWCKMFLSKNIFQYNMRFEKNRIIEDLFPAFEQVSFSKKIVFINEKLYKYRQRSTSILHSTDQLKLLKDQHHAYRMMAALVKNTKEIRKEKYYEFVILVQASLIKKCVELNIRCSKSIYDKYKIDDFKFTQILFDIKNTIKVKIKLLLYKFNILHFIYVIRKIRIYN